MNDRLPAWRRASSLARVVDLRYPSNRFAALAAMVAFTASLVTSAATATGLAIGPGLRNAAGIFLGWAIARELDPDRARSARYGVFVALPLLFLGVPGLAPLGAVLLAVRIILRSTGLPPTPLDLAGVVALAAASASTGPGVVPAFGLAAALVWDTVLPEPGGVRERFTASLTAVAAFAGTILSGALLSWEAPTILQGAVLGLAVLATTQLRREQPDAVADATRDRLMGARLTAARVLAAAVVISAFLTSGGDVAPALAPGVGALVGVAITRRHLDSRLSVEDTPSPEKAQQD